MCRGISTFGQKRRNKSRESRLFEWVTSAMLPRDKHLMEEVIIFKGADHKVLFLRETFGRTTRKSVGCCSTLIEEHVNKKVKISKVY